MRTTKASCSVPFILAALAVLSCVFLVHAAAAATTNYSGGYRRALLPREEAAVGMAGGYFPVVADEAGSAAGEDETTVRRMDMQTTQDYPGSGANSRHDPRNPY